MSETSTSSRPAPGGESGAFASSVDWLWRLFSSVRLALGLILAIAALGLASVFLPQAPANLTPGMPDYSAWLAQARSRFGPSIDALATLGLLSLTGSLWLRLLLSLLAVNTFICTVNRLPSIWREVFHPTVRLADSAFDSAGVRRSLVPAPNGVGPLEVSLREAIARHGFRLLVERDEATYLYADRNRFGRLGTLLTHLAIILFLVGALVTSTWGFRLPGFAVPEGSTRDVGLGTGLAVRVEAFADEYYPEGPPKDYRSDLVLYRDGVEVARQTVRVNEPLVYGGVRFHQASFGPAAVLRVVDESGRTIYEDGVALAFDSGGRPLGYFSLPERGLTAYAVGPAAGPDPSLSAGQVRLDLYRAGQRVAGQTLTQGQPSSIDGLTITLVRERQYTSLLVVSDPGATVIWLASGLLVVGMGATFYLPRRRLWARLREEPDGQVSVMLVSPAGKPTSEPAVILAEIERLSDRSAEVI